MGDHIADHTKIIDSNNDNLVPYVITPQYTDSRPEAWPINNFGTHKVIQLPDRYRF